MSDYQKQSLPNPKDSPDIGSLPKRDDTLIKEQVMTHQRLTSSIDQAEVLRKQSEALASALHLHAVQFCKNLAQDNPQSQLLVSEPKRVAEPVHWLTRRHEGKKEAGPAYFYRWKVTGNTHIFSIRASRGLIEFFIVPDKEVPHISMSEFGSRFRGSFVLAPSDRGLVWKLGNTRLSSDQALDFIEQFLSELSRQKIKTNETKIGNQQLIGSAEKRLELEKNNLLFKLLNQQEEMKGQLARDLHDSVIADLMMLKRYLAGDKQLSLEETQEIIDEVVLHLRDIVNDYSPRQLQEWGLKVGIEDLLDRMARRTGMECNFVCLGELPRFPDLVSLHIFRLVQEALNNAEKHSGASLVSVNIKASSGGVNTFTISDNGTGFDPDAVHLESDGGHSFGLEGMRERSELIQCFCPCKLDLVSSKENGTTITITVSTSE